MVRHVCDKRAMAESEELVAAEVVLVPLDGIRLRIPRESIKGLSADKETVKKVKDSKGPRLYYTSRRCSKHYYIG